MTFNRLTKLFVILFSLTAGGLVVWQLSRNLAGEDSVESSEPEVEDETAVMPIGSKSIGGALNLGEHIEPEPPKRPLLSGSKSFVILPAETPAEAVAIPGIPPVPADDNSEQEDPLAE